MAKFVTYIADPELESAVIKAISAIGGELAIRGVSMEQVKLAESAKDITLICARQIDFAYRRVIVDKTMTVEEISAILQPQSSVKHFQFNPGKSKVICFVGLSGGVGTTSLAINYAFEKSESSSVLLADLDAQHPDVAISLGLHRIENRLEKIKCDLSVIQGLPENVEADYMVFDLGCNLDHPLLTKADEILLVTRTGSNTLSRLQACDLKPSVLILNFAERTKVQNKWRQQLQEKFPRLSIINMPSDLKSFENAADSKSALIEVASNSLARKTIATLG